MGQSTPKSYSACGSLIIKMYQNQFEFIILKGVKKMFENQKNDKILEWQVFSMMYMYIVDWREPAISWRGHVKEFKIV